VHDWCETQAFIEEFVRQISTVSASPGFTWGGSGNIKNAYLLNDTVPSNTAGRLSPVNGTINTIFITCEDPTNGVIEIRRRVGAVYTPIVTQAMGGVRKLTVEIAVPPTVAKNDELTCFVTNAANIKNPVVGIIIRGTL